MATALVSVDPMPRVLGRLPMWLAVAAFLAGAAFSILLARGVRWARTAFAAKGSRGAWMVYMAVAADLLSDGLMTGAGSAVARRLGLLLGLSQVVANVPGGFAAMANFRDEGVLRRSRLLIGASFAVPMFVGAGIGFLVLRGAGKVARHAALAFVVGVLLLATVEDVVPRADEPRARCRVSTIAFTAGFAFFALLPAYVG